MRKRFCMIALTGLFAAPAAAVGIEDLAQVVLGGGAVLKKAEQTCANVRLVKNDQLALTFARAAAEQALPISQFQAIDQIAVSDAAKEAESKGFCQGTKKKKSGMMAKIKKAGKALVKARILGV
jgi:antitoxin component of RelBE/YafQ-DinJ toxin-antitoxin module